MSVEWNLIEFQTTPGACFSKVPKLFGSISGDIILFLSSKRRRLEVRNFAVIFIFIPFTTYEKKTALQNKEVGVLGMAFRAGKVFGTFEKRAPGRLFRLKRVPLATNFFLCEGLSYFNPQEPHQVVIFFPRISPCMELWDSQHWSLGRTKTKFDALQFLRAREPSHIMECHLKLYLMPIF